MPVYLSVSDVAGVLKVSSRTVTRWIAEGNLTAFKIGGTVRIKQSDFEKFLDENESGEKSNE